MSDVFSVLHLPLGDWINNDASSVIQGMRPVFQIMKWPVDHTLDAIQSALVSTSPIIILAAILLIAWHFSGFRTALFCVVAMAFIGIIGMWESAMITVALVSTAVTFTLLIGIPLGLWAGRSDTVSRIVRPVLDVMQTMPAFAYLVPVVILLGIGNVPGAVVTIVFALPPIVRLTELGIRQVPENLVEAAYAFGSSPMQVLLRIQVPLAMRSIMVGINQTILMALAMTVITSMIAVEGLGMQVLRGIGRLDIGLASTGGLAIVILAMVFDRITQGVGAERRGTAGWTHRGPTGAIVRLVRIVVYPART